MRRLLPFLFFFFLISYTFAAAKQGDTEFAGIPFGSEREKVIEEILKLGYEPYGMAESADRIVIPVFMMGELPVQVDFLFNRNGKFYSFEIRTGKVEGNRLEKVFDAIDYMGEQFNLKYGKGVKKKISEQTELHHGVNLYKEWFAVRSLNISTAIVVNDNRYYSIGIVVHRELAKEMQKKKQKTHEKALVKPAF